MLFLYNQNPTEGQMNGVQVSIGEDFSNPLSFELNSATADEQIAKCAIRCQEGFKVDGQARISLEVADTEDTLSEEEERALCAKFAFGLSEESFSGFGEALTVNAVEDTNVLVYVKRKVEQGELPSVENRVRIVVEGTIAQK